MGLGLSQFIRTFRDFGPVIAVGLVVFGSICLSGCQLKRRLIESTDESTLDAIPFSRAGTEAISSLNDLRTHAFQSAPAAVRPDPDLFVRRLLKQFRPDGNTMARQLGKIEQYRLMLGGATDDFRTVPQNSYDSTSLLTLQRVGQLICASLIAPSPREHPGWESVLPNDPSEIAPNIKFLMSKIIGLSESSLNPTAVAELSDMVTELTAAGASVTDSYVYACTAIALDGEALLL